LNDAELPFPKIKDPEGNEIQVSHGRYRAGLFSQDRDYRRDIYKATYVPYDMLKGTMAELYNGRGKERITFAKLRKYNSAVEAALKPNNIPVSVYENLVRVTRDNVKTLHRWAKIRKQVLKLDEFHPYDTYVSLFPSVSKEYTFEEAKEIALKALAPLGEEYIAAVKKSFDNRWIDVYETKSKRSGAYSNSSGSGPHPFILLNWNNTLDDLFTLVHEVGHNMHSYFTEKAQPFQYRDYATFVAEVASISNEALLTDYLLENAKTKEEKLMLYEKFLTGVQATFFRQTRFAEYEKIIHEKAEKGEFMTADMLTKEFASLYQYYWGDNMTVDYEEGLSWARIPHLFKYNFYVYQYATGFAAAFALTRNIKNEGRPAIERYLKFLSSGSSKYPIDILKDAGVDMTKPDAVEALIKKANEYLDELEQLIK
jgi:oligoendopeptidase F